jgi:molybdate transport system substrate-binding protein
MSHRPLTAWLLAGLAVIATATTAACTPAPTPPTDDGPRTLTVYAAASLTEAFGEIATTFDAAHSGVTTTVSYDGSSTLAEQILEGAPADVFASADLATMAKVVDAGLIAPNPPVVAVNELTIAVPADNPAAITSLADLGRDDVRVVLCAPAVPCGAVAHRVLDAAAVAVTPVSEEVNVKGVLTKIAAGEGDAGLIYQTDVAAAAGAVTAIALPDPTLAQTPYPMGIVSASNQIDLAEAFVVYVQSAAGQAILATYGFGTPPTP